jgi:uncharacterized protein with HEPN domain
LKDDSVYIKHILEEIGYLLKESRDLTLEQLLGDQTRQKAFIRSLEVIGEASKNISPAFKEKNRTIEWKELAGLRDKLIHFYFGVDWNIVWDVIKHKIPELENKINKLPNK